MALLKTVLKETSLYKQRKRDRETITSLVTSTHVHCTETALRLSHLEQFSYLGTFVFSVKIQGCILPSATGARFHHCQQI